MNARSFTPFPAPNEVYVHTIELRSLGDAVAPDERCLDAAERARAQAFRSTRARTRFVSARVRLRELLGGHLGLAPERVALRAGERGKPATNGIWFNLAHAGDLALVAVASDREVGIDLEAVRPVADAAAIASRFFTPGEAERIAAVPAARRGTSFFACWTRKEAVVKALGLGLAIPFDSFAVSLPGDEPARVLEARGAVAPASQWSVTHLAARSGYVGALAVRGTRPRIVRW